MKFGAWIRKNDVDKFSKWRKFQWIFAEWILKYAKWFVIHKVIQIAGYTLMLSTWEVSIGTGIGIHTPWISKMFYSTNGRLNDLWNGKMRVVTFWLDRITRWFLCFPFDIPIYFQSKELRYDTKNYVLYCCWHTEWRRFVNEFVDGDEHTYPVNFRT